MKFCPHCGKENTEDAVYCVNCGKEIEQPQEPNNQPSQMAGQYPSGSTVGKSSLILGIFSLVCTVICCCFPVVFILAPISIILALVSIFKHKNDSHGKAIAGLICAGIALAVCIFIVIMIPQVMEYLEEYVVEFCQTNPTSDECETFKEAFPQWFK